MTHRKSKHYISWLLFRGSGCSRDTWFTRIFSVLSISISWFPGDFDQVDIFLRFSVATLVGCVRSYTRTLLSPAKEDSLQLWCTKGVNHYSADVSKWFACFCVWQREPVAAKQPRTCNIDKLTFAHGQSWFLNNRPHPLQNFPPNIVSG